ncbi:hypothetical protein ACFTAO_28485 [Paenibacillus rhizoplanae]
MLHQLLSRSNNTSGNAALQTASTLLSWSIYGVTYRWNKEGRQETPAVLAGRLVPLISSGVSMLTAPSTE